tara:strand:+ start:4286 stop:4771 length:486 start_codon:yes stop_codon:yes gene_type:complete
MIRGATENYLPFTRQILATSAVLCLFLSGCGDPASTGEEEIRQWISDGHAEVEAKERRALLARVSPGYADARGYDKDRLDKLLRVYFLRQNAIKLLVSIQDIRIFGDTAAEVDLTVALTGTNDRALGFSASAYKFELELVRDDDDWQLIAARWGELGDSLN